MSILNKVTSFFKKEQKSSCSTSYSNSSFSNFLLNGSQNLNFGQLIGYYSSVSPVFNSVDLIAREGAEVKPVIFDKETDEFTDDFPLIDLLNNPGNGLTGRELFESLYSFYEITGNAFLIATGPIDSPPKELIVVSPQSVSVTYGQNGQVSSIMVSGYSQEMTFNRLEDKNGIHFVDKSVGEIWHIRTFSPFNTTEYNNFFGMSRLSPIAYEVDQFIHASQHNLSLLKRGAKPSGAIIVNSAITDDTQKQLQNMASSFLGGAENAGRIPVLSNGMDFKELGLSNRDMDFEVMERRITQRIYNAYQVPLSLISSDATTFDNYKTGIIRLYQGPVLNTVTKFYEELTRFLMHRYDDSGKLSIKFDPNSIPSLTSARVDELSKLSSLSILSDNEMRSFIGLDGYDGGDTVYKAQNQLSVGDATSEDEAGIEEDLKSKDYENVFKESLILKLKDNGERLYTDEQVNRIVKYRSILQQKVKNRAEVSRRS